ncbi:MAG TPA: hypothetical protein VEB19_16500 [Gemmatimonadaceae bacterium]|nr:hypothetical protein [Gemmatimonadaceae bacterium]
MQGKPQTKPRRPTPADHRRAISRQTWLSNRAQNALHRPAFIGAISVGTFVTALVSMVVVPRAQDQKPVPIAVVARPDTLSVLGNIAAGRLRLLEVDSSLAAARQEIAARDSAARAAFPVDTVMSSVARRDSLRSQSERLRALLSRAESAPLLSSYRALAAAPGMNADPRVRAMLDTLSDIDRERESFGAVGGVDPIFVALTNRASEIGRSLQGIAASRLNALNAEIGPETPVAPTVAEAPPIDTTIFIATADSTRAAIAQAETELAQLRNRAREMDLEEERARERASAVAPPLALLAAAFVLSAVIGFGVALLAELRRPRVSNSAELERFLGVRVLSTIETAMPSVDRGRREADRMAPPYFDPGAEGYQLAYLGLATEHPSLLMTTVTGNDPTVTAVVACNLAAVAADEARNTLVIDLDGRCRASAALRARFQPGIVDVTNGSQSWPDVTVAAPVGRNRSVDLVPCGGSTPDAQGLIEMFRRDANRLARYYDAVFVIADVATVAAGIPAAVPSPGVIFCAQPGLTPLRTLRSQLEAIRSAGGVVRGVVLWDAERPMLPTPRELTKPRRTRSSEREVAIAAP